MDKSNKKSGGSGQDKQTSSSDNYDQNSPESLTAKTLLQIQVATLKSKGEIIEPATEAKMLKVHIDDAELQKRKAAWKTPAPREKAGVLAKYAKCVKSASEGAVTY